MGWTRSAARRSPFIAALYALKDEALSQLPQKDLDALKGLAYHPSLRLIGPFTPLLAYSNEPYFLLLVLLTPLDYFSYPSRLSRQHIPNYKQRYLSIFIVCLIVRIALVFLPSYLWLVPALISPFLIVAWGKFAWQSWWVLYNSAQESNNGI